ncbi:MAG: hypothetical protein J5494_00090 [Candidatus Methanomethylophilaceae archaeon]|nr:hypothetical protein [Candidatus Methanomethylophilaceae archaeon]
MSKRTKRRRDEEPPAESSQKSSRGIRTAVMILIFLVIGLLYYALVSMQVVWVTPALYILAAVLFLVFFFVNRGFSSRLPEREQLPEGWSEEQKDLFLEEEGRRKRIARPIMVVLVPVLLLVAADMLYLVLIRDLLS